MNTGSKEIVPLIIVLLAGCLFLRISGQEFLRWNVDLMKTDKISGIITKTYQTIIQPMGKNGPTEAFVFTLDTHPKALGFYLNKKNSSIFRDSLNIGDSITVFLKLQSNESINLNVYQIEKGDNIILNFQQYKSDRLNLLPTFVIVGLISVMLSIYKLFRL